MRFTAPLPPPPPPPKKRSKYVQTDTRVKIYSLSKMNETASKRIRSNLATLESPSETQTILTVRHAGNTVETLFELCGQVDFIDCLVKRLNFFTCAGMSASHWVSCSTSIFAAIESEVLFLLFFFILIKDLFVPLLLEKGESPKSCLQVILHYPVQRAFLLAFCVFWPYVGCVHCNRSLVW